MDYKSMALQHLNIPDFDGSGTMEVVLQRPRLLAMAEMGKIPNPMLNAANDAMFGKNKSKAKEPELKSLAETISLYCAVCLVEPTYDEVKDYLTDAQMLAIWNWVMGKTKSLDTFRKNKEDGSGNHNGQEVPPTAK